MMTTEKLSMSKKLFANEQEHPLPPSKNGMLNLLQLFIKEIVTILFIL
jgi:hypothetical protein